MKMRIVTDTHAGYEVQVWRWWFPFWVAHRRNTHPTVEKAEEYARRAMKFVVKEVTL